MKHLLALTLITLSTSSFGDRNNVWVWDDNGYNCRTEQLCSGPLDLPSYGIVPIRPLPSNQIKPIERFVIPPIRTTNYRRA